MKRNTEQVHIVAECLYFTINEVIPAKKSVKRCAEIYKLHQWGARHFEDTFPEPLTVRTRVINPTLFP